MKIKGVISDMDGVILDSEKLYVRFWCEAARFYGHPMEQKHALGIRSMNKRFASEKLKGWFGNDFDYDAVRRKRIELMDKYIEENGIEAKSGAKHFLSCVKQKGLKLALATATPPERAERYLKRLDLYKYFDEIVCSSMVSNGKPEPDIYLLASEKLGLKPCECLALEDSHNGIESAGRAGCKTVMVKDLDGPDEEDKPYLYAVADSLAEVEKLI